jgi:formate dehydrogenase iron-sulfur subunit
MGTSGIMMLIDTSKCMACKGCQVSCKAWHQLPAEDTSFTGTYENPPDLSVDVLTRVRFNEVLDSQPFKFMEWLFFKDQCRHCIGMRRGAPCQRACPVRGAIVTEAGGAIVITDKCNPSRCNRDCEDACPYDIPRNDGGKEKKCDFCYDRIEDGMAPSCAETCPPGAITFGSASYVQGVASARLSELLARYPNANIYPNGHCGGGHETRVIWLLIDDPSAYGITDGGGGGGMHR